MPRRALSLAEAAAEKLRRGVPLLPLSELPPAARDFEAGSPAVLVDCRGEPLAGAVADPENEAFRVLSWEPTEAFDRAFFLRRVEAARDLRRALGLLEGEAPACRLLNGEGDSLSGFAADAFGRFVVLYVYSRGLFALGKLLAEAIREVHGAEGVVVKLRPREGPRPGRLKQEIVGKAPPEKLVVEEYGVPFEVHLASGLNVGLFTDMREHRRGLRRFVSGRRVLNVFAYTGSLSVVAALGGASEVTSVDLSSGVLKWARENFRLSGLDPESAAYRFEATDAMRFLRGAAGRGASFETVILDPPTYSAARASEWSMKNDYPEAIALAARLLPEGRAGFLWVSANVRGSRSLLRHVEEGLCLAGRRGRVLEVGGLPPDYPTPVAYPEARYLEVCQLEV